MTDFWEAYVASERGADRVARIAKLTTSSLTLRDAPGLSTGERVTVTFFSVSIDGVVTGAAGDAVDVAFEASQSVLARIVERIREVHGFVPPDPVDDSTTSSTPAPNPGLARALTSHAAERVELTDRGRAQTVAERPPNPTADLFDTEDLPTTEPGGVPIMVMEEEAAEDPEEETTEEIPPEIIFGSRSGQHSQMSIPAQRRPRIVKNEARERQLTDLDPKTLIDDDELTPKKRRAGGSS